MAARIVAALLGAFLAAWGLFAPSSARAEDMTGSIAVRVTTEAPATGHRSVLPAVAQAARLSGDTQRTRLVFDLTRVVEMRAFALADPYRVIVDTDELTFALPGTSEGTGLVSTFRFGLFAPGKSRIVIDLAEPARIERAVVTEAREAEPPRLVIELARTDAEGFRRAMADRATSNLARRGDREHGTRAMSRATRAPAALPVIVIDPGHGGIDSGAVAGSGEAEKTLVLDFSRVLRDKLAATGRYRVVMTRDRDMFVPLSERVRIARRAQAALFVSVHADSISGAEDNARGVTVYTLSDQASDADAQRLAERENRVDAIAGLDLTEEPDEIADILLDLTRRETRIFSQNFARTLAGEMRGATRMHRLPLRSAGFQVLRAHDIPSVLVELGFVTSPSDLEMLTSAAWRDRTADSVVRAIDAFFAIRRPGQPAAQR